MSEKYDPKKRNRKGLVLNSFRNMTEIRTFNRRTNLYQGENSDEVTLVITGFIGKGLKFEKGQAISTSETCERGVLETRLGLSTEALRILHLLIGEHLKTLGVKTIPLGDREANTVKKDGN